MTQILTLERLRWALALSLLLISVAWPQVQPPEVFVQNRPYQGEVRVIAGKAYTRLKPLLEALGLQWKVEGETVQLLEKEGSNDDLNGVERLSFRGRMLPVEIFRMTGEAFVEMGPTVRGMGGTAQFNRALNTLDLAPPAPADRRPQGFVTDGRGSDRLKLKKLSYRVTQAPPGEGAVDQLHCYVEIYNESELRSVKGLEMRMRWMDGDSELWHYNLELPDLPPGGRHLQQMPLFRFQRGRDVRPEVES